MTLLFPKTQRTRETISSQVAGWKAWVRHNTPNINGCLKAVGHGILGLSTQFLKSGISLLDELREDGGGWLATIQQVIYNSGGSIEPFY